jgi:hypothetical protein
VLSTRALKQKVMPGGVGGIDSPAPVAYRKCGKFEVSTVQVDSFLQAAAPAGGDAFAGNVSTGIQIPTITQKTRFLCLLARAKFNIGRRVRLVGIRQYASIGATQNNGVGSAAYTSFFEKPIVSPRWRFPDGNISWHVMALEPNIPAPAFLGALPPGVTGNITNQPPGFAFVNTQTPAVLALTSGTDVFYGAPNGGRPFGKPLTPDLGNIHDLRWPWDSANSWHYSLDVPIEPPCDVCFFASVEQTDPTGRNNPTPPASPIAGAPAAGFSALGPEDQFLLTFPTSAIYWRVAGALIFAENCGDDQ